MAEGAVFMSQFMVNNFDKPYSQSLNNDIGNKWKVSWAKRDKAEFWYNLTLTISMLILFIANILYIVIH